MNINKYIIYYGSDHWVILRSSYRKLAWVGFEPTTTEFCWDALTDWAVRPWVQLTLKATFSQLLQFHCLLKVGFHFGYCLCPITTVFFKFYFNRGIQMSVAEWIDRYGIHHWTILRSSYRKLAWLGFEFTTTEFHSEALAN